MPLIVRAPGTSRFGRVWVDSHGRVQRFEEKTAMPGSDWINTGIYLLERRLIEEIPVDRFLSLERDLFPAWVAGKQVFGFRCEGRFLDIGTPEAYAEAELFFSSAEAS